LDINGSPSLPSYQDYRFRGPNTILFHASFEHSVYSRWPIGVAAMIDEGKIAMTHGDVDSSHLRHSYAPGLTLHAGGFPLVYLLFSWGGHEGMHTIEENGYFDIGRRGPDFVLLVRRRPPTARQKAKCSAWGAKRRSLKRFGGVFQIRRSGRLTPDKSACRKLLKRSRYATLSALASTAGRGLTEKAGHDDRDVNPTQEEWFHQQPLLNWGLSVPAPPIIRSLDHSASTE